MSLLYRTGNGRNNIAWSGGSTTSATYLRRTSSGRNNIGYISISTSGTWNLLNRTSTGRNNIAWQNTTFNFADLSKLSNAISDMYEYSSNLGITGRANIVHRNAGYYYPNISFTRNTIVTGAEGDYMGLRLPSNNPYTYQLGIVVKPSYINTVTTELLKFSRVTIGSNTVNITGNASSVKHNLSGEDGVVVYIQLSETLFNLYYSNYTIIFS